MRVGVLGAGGRMGSEVCRTVAGAADLELVAGADPGHVGTTVAGVEISDARDVVLEAGCEAVVDFTHPDAAPENLAWCVGNGMHCVVGTSGFDAVRIAAARALVGEGPPNAVIVPNFAVGAVLMMRFAELAAPHMDRVEVIELHHDAKADAPSGTAVATAEAIQSAREAAGGWPAHPDSTEVVAGSRGGLVGDVRVHAVRLPGLVAHQEVIFGAQGQVLTIRHDSMDRTSFMPGVLLALRAVPHRPGLTVGLAPVLGL